MNRYEDKEVSFAPPAAWADRTIVAYVAPPGPGTGAHIFMTRDAIRDGDSLRTHADRQTMQLAKEIDQFEVLESTERDVGGRRAIQTRLAWPTPAGAIEQIIVYVDPGIVESDKPSRVPTFTATLGPQSNKSAMRAAFEQMLTSVRFGPSATPGPPEPPRYVTAPADAPSVPKPGSYGVRR